MNSLVEFWNQCGALAQTVIAIGGAIILFVAIRNIALKRLESLAASTENDFDDRLVHLVKKFLCLVMLFVTALIVCQINGIEITPLLAGAGIAGVALGFAAKETVADLLSGIFLITDRPIRIGDRIKIEHIGRHWGSWGDVVDIGLRRTRIKNTDGVIVNYPNSVLTNSVISNFSYEPEPVRVRVRFQVDYDVDLRLAEKTAIRAIESCEGVIADSAQIVVRSLWDETGGHLLSGILLEARYRIREVRHRTAIRSRVLTAILDEFRTDNIEMAYPRLVINSKSNADYQV